MPIAARCSAWLGDLASTLIFSPRFGIQQRAGYAIQRLLPERAIFSDLDGFCRRNFADAMQCGSGRVARSEGTAGAHRPETVARSPCTLSMTVFDQGAPTLLVLTALSHVVLTLMSEGTLGQSLRTMTRSARAPSIRRGSHAFWRRRSGSGFCRCSAVSEEVA